MKKLSDTDYDRKLYHADKLDALRGKVEDALADFNQKVQALWTPVAEAVEVYNEAATDAQGWRDDIVNEMQDYIDARSDKWRESDAGLEYESWKADWDSANIDEIELDAPEEIEMPDVENPLRDLEPAP